MRRVAERFWFEALRSWARRSRTGDVGEGADGSSRRRTRGWPMSSAQMRLARLRAR